MPPFFLIVFLLITATWFTDLFVLIPLEFLRALSIPTWLTWAGLGLVLFWCFGE